MGSSENGRVVVVTGANEGIGYHTLAALRADGYRVAGLDIETGTLDTLAAAHPEDVLALVCDVTVDAQVKDAVDAVLERWGRIDILLNNAAVFHFGAFEDTTMEDKRHEFEVNYFGYVRMIRAVLPHMRERNAGLIHNVGSGVGLVGNPGLSGYGATKGAVESLTRSLRLELQHTDIDCTLVYPPLTGTRSARELDYADSLMQSPEAVGRKIADKIESTGPVVFADWQTRLGLALATRVPYMVKRGTQRFVAAEGTTAGN